MTALLERIVNTIQPTVVQNSFPDAFLGANGYQRQGNYWGANNQLFWTLQTVSGFDIHVVDNVEVWIERYGKLSQLTNVITGEDLLNLERLLG